jgi:hypothetical protein
MISFVALIISAGLVLGAARARDRLELGPLIWWIRSRL